MSASIEDLLRRIGAARPDPILLRDDEVHLLSIWLETTRPTLEELSHGDRDHLRFVLEFNRRQAPTDESATSRTGGPPEAEVEPDGPFPPDGFRWKGKEHRRCEPLPWRLLSCLWSRPNRCAPFRDLAEPVWQDHEQEVDAGTFGGVRKRLNAWLKAHDLPFRAGSKANVAVLEEI